MALNSAICISHWGPSETTESLFCLNHVFGVTSASPICRGDVVLESVTPLESHSVGVSPISAVLLVSVVFWLADKNFLISPSDFPGFFTVHFSSQELDDT